VEIDNLFGIPAHPLLVHLPVILVPIAALAALLAVAWPKHRRRIAWFATGLTAVALVSTQFAIGSGEALRHRVKDTPLVRKHVSMGDSVRLYVLVLLIGLIVLAMLPHSSYTSAQAKRRRAAVATTAVVIVIAALGSVFSIIQVGHSGAKAVWNDTPARGTVP
jgi:uncharacterized membrane protein